MRSAHPAHSRPAALRGAALVTLLACLLLGGPGSALAQSQDEYVVKQGDTLLAIANSQRTTVDELLQANGLSRTSLLSLGQVLKIPRPAPAVAEPAPVPPEPAVAVEEPAPA